MQRFDEYIVDKPTKKQSSCCWFETTLRSFDTVMDAEGKDHLWR